jgi:hypothetical protein
MKTAKEILADDYLEEKWTLESIKREAQKLRANYAVGSDRWHQALNVLNDIGTIDAKLNSFPDPAGAAQRALEVGLRWASIMHDLEHPRGKGKTEAPEWPFIREAYRATKRSKKPPTQKEIIDAGLQRFQKDKRQASERDVSYFLPHFKELVLNKKSR